ncbi:hypothetical protein VB002_05765 [Campylobacter concisus]
MKFFNAFFTGIIFVLAPIFTLFVGIYNNYFSFYGINEYFNVIFVDNVPFLWLLPVFFIFGYCFFYAPFRKILEPFICSCSCFAHLVGILILDEAWARLIL